jgi:hypothetical protein
MVRYKMVCFKTVKRYKAVRGSKRYISKRLSYKTVHATKQYTVTKRYIKNSTLS